MASEEYLALARVKLEKISRLELLRQVFRWPLEVWLVLDRVLFLQEQNYDVNYGVFCEKQLTPRNILIMASKRSGI